jgi:hypothetical protein
VWSLLLDILVCSLAVPSVEEFPKFPDNAGLSIGVSGGHWKEDMQCAEAGLAALGIGS